MSNEEYDDEIRELAKLHNRSPQTMRARRMVAKKYGIKWPPCPPGKPYHPLDTEQMRRAASRYAHISALIALPPTTAATIGAYAIVPHGPGWSGLWGSAIILAVSLTAGCVSIGAMDWLFGRWLRRWAGKA